MRPNHEFSEGTCSSISDPSPEKKQKRAKDFFASITKKNAKTKVIDEVDTFLKLCGNFDDLRSIIVSINDIT
ncbi:hypothetical protein OUZ56_032121 [Daphnia magna]|uniref:Uncharacterized protein n=1 Tax=Daphnia magna TaxID=35525 RepID=A0ABQ9ZWZ7_9CRUS|nr:hypothetical protein OUZ56_032121 [Daphnia magna]